MRIAEIPDRPANAQLSIRIRRFGTAHARTLDNVEGQSLRKDIVARN
jgi:uncharacterized protein with GYD domain